MLKEKAEFQKKALLITDIATIFLAFFLAYVAMPHLRLAVFPDKVVQLMPFNNYLWIAIVVCPVWIFLLFIFKGYESVRFITFFQAIKSVFASVSIGLLELGFIFYIFKIPIISRLLVVTFGLFSFLLLVANRHVAKVFLLILYKHPYNIRSVVIIGTRRRAKFVIEKMLNDRKFEFDIVGCLGLSNVKVGENVFEDVKVIDKVDNLGEIIETRTVDDIIIAADLDETKNPSRIFDMCEDVGIKVHIVPNYQLFDYHRNTKAGKIEIEDFLQIPMLTISSTPANLLQLYVKRVFDFLFSGFLLIVLSPLFLTVAVLIKLTTKGPVFYQWKVVGLNNREFVSYKFRTMVENADQSKKELEALNEMNGPVFKIKNDPRITKVGRFLRKYSLDELPQLYSVFKGDMSLVGPRPPFREEVQRFEFWQRRKLSVKPGITCLWQVRGRNEIRDFSDWANLDLEYIDSWSIWLDIKILLKTIPAVVMGTGS